ncbi:MAG: hypothetical protein HBSIN02_15740 [Bacteroidia bacterium]|nr:MAG: hypothetical protein HBSIN02_15740 [Bacteroidia bacterium]
MIVVVKNTFRENIVQPFALFALILVTAAVGLVSFGVTLHYESDMLISINLFGTPIDQSAAIVRDTLANTASALLNAALMFLFIMGASFVHVDMLKNPLTGISLTGPISRAGLFMGKLVGAWFVGFSIFFVLWGALWLTLFFKSSGQVSAGLLLGALSLSLEYAVMLSLAALMAMVVQNSTAVAILCLVLYFSIGPLLASTDHPSVLLRVISTLFPPLAEMQEVSRSSILGHPGDFAAFLRAVPHTLVYLLAGMYVFHKRDIAG